MSISGPPKKTGAKELQKKNVMGKEKIERGEYVESTTQNSFYYFLRTIFLAMELTQQNKVRIFVEMINCVKSGTNGIRR